MKEEQIFGGDGRDGGQRPPGVTWPLRAVNSIEGELRQAMILENAVSGPPMIWIEGDGEADGNYWNAADYAESYGEQMTLREASALSDMVSAQIQKRYRLQLITARELGANATKELYRLACAEQGIDPIV